MTHVNKQLDKIDLCLKKKADPMTGEYFLGTFFLALTVGLVNSKDDESSQSATMNSTGEITLFKKIVIYRFYFMNSLNGLCWMMKCKHQPWTFYLN